MQKQSSLLGKGCGSVMPNSSGKVAVGLSPPPIPRRAQDPAAGMCQGFVLELRSPLEPRAPPAPQSAPFSHSLFTHVLLFILQTAYAKSNFTAGSAPRVCFPCLHSALASSACATAQRWRQRRGRRGEWESRAGGEGNGSRLLLAKPLFV